MKRKTLAGLVALGTLGAYVYRRVVHRWRHGMPLTGHVPSIWPLDRNQARRRRRAHEQNLADVNVPPPASSPTDEPVSQGAPPPQEPPMGSGC